jgi:hypothetical protein
MEDVGVTAGEVAVAVAVAVAVGPWKKHFGYHDHALALQGIEARDTLRP